MIIDLADWMELTTGPEWVWFVKRLAANDTKASGANQAGPLISKGFLAKLFPALDTTLIKNPDVHFPLAIPSHADVREVRAVYYNNKFFENPKSGRDEIRITRFGGIASPLLDPESTGSLSIFAFRVDGDGHGVECEVWVARDEVEEDLIEDRVGPVEPGKPVVWPPEPLPLWGESGIMDSPCSLKDDQVPSAWLTKFPAASELTAKAVELRPLLNLAPDQRIIRRRDCEYELFLSVERAMELPVIKKGFQTIKDFVTLAHTILQRRKSRSGRSLELHARQIFIEEQLVEHQDFSHQPVSEGKKRPDFLFPSQAAYQDPSFPKDRLRMLAVKTTCKDRWRQICKEADRVEVKHLLTLQEGVSQAQFDEMVAFNVRLVVPSSIMKSYPPAIRPNLQSLESFIGDVRLLQV